MRELTGDGEDVTLNPDLRMHLSPRIAIFDHLSVLGDPVRCRIVRLLEEHELTVSELCEVLQMPQSSVSRHLKLLADDGWLSSRKDGTSRLYSVPGDALDAGAARLWPILREQLGSLPAAGHDGRRLEDILARRRERSQEFFATAAGQWDRLREDLFGAVFYLQALIPLLASDAVVGDLGCGTGQVSATLAPWVKRVVAVDSSSDMLLAARARLRAMRNVIVKQGHLEQLPVRDGELDIAMVSLVLHHVPDPGRALSEVGRAVKPGGRVLVVDMLPHDRAEYRQGMGHVWLGFSTRHVTKLMAAAGFGDVRVGPLPVDRSAKGPALFVAAATRQVTGRAASEVGRTSRVARRVSVHKGE
jgi:ubiquinone/menaquinone biosynthesis C-methylase UbiE